MYILPVLRAKKSASLCSWIYLGCLLMYHTAPFYGWLISSIEQYLCFLDNLKDIPCTPSHIVVDTLWWINSPNWSASISLGHTATRHPHSCCMVPGVLISSLLDIHRDLTSIMVPDETSQQGQQRVWELLPQILQQSCSPKISLVASSICLMLW